MRVLNTGSDVEEAVADALVRILHLPCVGYTVKIIGVCMLKHAKELCYFIAFKCVG